MPKYNFSVTTRNGHKIPSVQIYGTDLPDAERKLRQMYIHCEVTQSSVIEEGRKLFPSANIEDMLSLIVNDGMGF